jgi:hypothetical protein
MNCQNFESIVNELARRQMMEANAREQALAHTDECEACALRLEDERALTQKLEALTSEMSGTEAPARIETELLAAFRNQKSTNQSTNQFAKRGRWVIHDWRYWATAAAAVLLIVIGIAAMRSRPAPVAKKNPSVPTLPSTTASAKDSVKPVDDVEQPKPAVDEPKPAELPKQGTTLASRDQKRHLNSLSARDKSAGSQREQEALTAEKDTTVAANSSGNEIATDFFPVGYTSPMNLQDGGQVMRVELPRSTLAGFGLPVNMERINERVKADVLVGPDGQARAIRFVQ